MNGQTGDSLLDCPALSQAARFPDGFGTRFIVTIDTEEDFDWSQPFSRSGYTLDSVYELGRCQAYFAAAGVTPLYLVDFPVTTHPEAQRVLGDAAQAGACDIGLQLHPWVNPPFDEAVCHINSFAGNLPPALEAAKIAELYQSVRDAFGVEPRAYRAGRYGAGPHTAQTLAALGIACDTSVRAGFSYAAEGGPDYAGMPLAPWWTGPDHRLLELPLTTLFSGWLGARGEGLYHALTGRLPSVMALLARVGVMERISLTPEGIPVAKACVAIDQALALGLPVLNFSFHSPSLAPGKTPYVQTVEDREALYGWWDAVLAHLARRGIAPVGLGDILAAATR